MDNKNVIFQGHIVQLETQSVKLPNGHIMDMEIVRHPGGAAVVALNQNTEICLLRQYRCVLDQWLWEIPAGKIDAHEPPLQTAQRELKEEAGIQALQWQSLGSSISSPGVFTEQVYLYLATELESVTASVEDTEVIEVHWLQLEKAYQMALSGEISDAKSVVALFRAMEVYRQASH